MDIAASNVKRRFARKSWSKNIGPVHSLGELQGDPPNRFDRLATEIDVDLTIEANA